jgi:hypothetical protein
MEFFEKGDVYGIVRKVSLELQQKICLQTRESLYGPKHVRKTVQDVWFIHGEPNFTRSEYNHCVYGIFIILVLNVMLVASTNMFEINMLAQLVRTFDMKDLGAAK